MAYEGGGLRQIWQPDLTTRAGAQSAMDSAKLCFLIVAGLRTLLYGFFALTSGLSFRGLGGGRVAASLLAVAVLTDIILPLVAAWRLHIYKGAFVVPLATALYVLGIVLAPSIGGVIIGAIFIGAFVGGVRGAWALRRGTGFAEDHCATFG